MKSSRSVRFLSNKPVYALVAIYIPLVMFTSFLFLLGGLLREITPFNLLIPITGGIISALAATFYCDFMKDTKSSRDAANIRGGIIIILASYLLSSILYSGGGDSLFFPNINNISTAIGALYVWDSVISLKQLFSARKCFDEYTELYSGEKLQEVLFGDNGVLKVNDEEIVRVRNGFIIQLVLTGILLIMNTFSDTPMSMTIYLLMILTLENAVCFLGFLEIFRWEQNYAGNGIALPAFDMIRRMIWIGILSAFCTVWAIIFSSNKNILHFSWIIDFFKWLFRLFRRPPPPVEADLTKIDIQPILQPVDMEPVFSDLPAKVQPSFPFWDWLLYGLIALAAAGFLWFMISPLFRKEKKSKLKIRKRLSLIIKEWLKGLLNAFTSFAAFVKNDKTKQKLRKPNADEIRRTVENILGAYSHAKKGDMRKSAALFAQLIIWGGEVRHIIWKPSHAPGEYCALLAASVPDKMPPASVDALAANPAGIAPAILRCGEIFEKAIYSAEELSDTERKEFNDLIEKIISSPA